MNDRNVYDFSFLRQVLVLVAYSLTFILVKAEHVYPHPYLVCSTVFKLMLLELQKAFVLCVSFSRTSMKHMLKKNAILWDVTPCRSCVNLCFRGMYRFPLQDRKIRERGTSMNMWLWPALCYLLAHLYRPFPSPLC
jgi:hypothetical protein